MALPQAAQYFYRAFSDSSASGLVCGKGRGGQQLPPHELLSEFENQIRCQTLPTALISVTVSFIDVLRRAFNKFYIGDKPDQIWIVFISVPHDGKGIYHRAEHLAREIGLDETSQFKNEYLFEWEILEKCVVHKVSVQTLLRRGLNMEHYCRHVSNLRQLPPASLLRQEIAKDILDPSNGGYEIGLSLGFMARHFGARAPVLYIAHQILSKCTPFFYVNHDAQTVSVSYWRGHKTTLSFEHFNQIERGINKALFEMWLSNLDFYSVYKEHCRWVSRLEEEIDREWVTFGEDHYRDDVCCTDQRYQMLRERNNNIHKEIEIAAIKLGL